MLELIIGLQRLFFNIAAVGSLGIIVGDAVVELWDRGDKVWSILAAVGFPITFLVWPWTHEAWGIPLWVFFIVGTISWSIIRSYDRDVGPA